MNLSGILGIVFALFAILAVLFSRVDFAGYFVQPLSIFIVIVGTLSSINLNFSFASMVGAIQSAFKIFINNQDDSNNVIKNIAYFAHTARKNGVFALESVIEGIDDPFLKRGVKLTVDINNPQLISEILNNEIKLDHEQELVNSELFESTAKYIQGFGVVASLAWFAQETLTSQNLVPMERVIAVSILPIFCCFYLSNMIFMPIAGKLKMMLREKILLKEMIVHGLVSIQMGESPVIIEEKLVAFLRYSNKNNNVYFEELLDSY